MSAAKVSVNTTRFGRAHRECIHMLDTLDLVMCSSPAFEYYESQRYLALKYWHLDLSFEGGSTSHFINGIIPEVCGVSTQVAASEHTASSYAALMRMILMQ